MKKKYSLASTSEKLRVLMPWLREHKAKEPLELDLTGQNAFTEALVIATATSVRHGQSLADGIAELCSRENFEFLRMEGYQAGQWILVDLNDIVVNIFQEPVRELYRLETLWTGAVTPTLGEQL